MLTHYNPFRYVQGCLVSSIQIEKLIPADFQSIYSKSAAVFEDTTSEAERSSINSQVNVYSPLIFIVTPAEMHFSMNK